MSQLAEINLGLPNADQMLKMLISELVVVDKHDQKKKTKKKKPANQILVIIIHGCLSHSHICSLK